jgi:hypothetical protein
VSIGYGFLLYRDDGSPVGGVSLPGGAEANWYYFTFEIGNGHGHSTGGPEELLLLWAGGRALETLGALAREALAALRAARAAGGATPALRSFTASNFRTNLARLTGRIPEGAQAHHILPQEFAPQFQRLGLNIHDPRFGAWWQGGAHQQAASAYNQAWRQFLSTNPTAEQALQFAREISGSYGLTVGF